MFPLWRAGSSLGSATWERYLTVLGNAEVDLDKDAK